MEVLAKGDRSLTGVALISALSNFFASERNAMLLIGEPGTRFPLVRGNQSNLSLQSLVLKDLN